MVNVTSNFTSGLKKVVANHYSSDEVLLHLFQNDFSISMEESSREEVNGTYAYFGSPVVDPSAVIALRRAVANSLASSRQFS